MTSVWHRRRRRAVSLMSRMPDAEELLGFYVAVLEAQERVGSEAEPGDDGPLGDPVGRVGREIHGHLVIEGFRRFVATVADVAPEPLRRRGTALARSESELLRRALVEALRSSNSCPDEGGQRPRRRDRAGDEGSSRRPGGESGETVTDPGTAFYADAFLQAFLWRPCAGVRAEALSRSLGGRTCPACGRRPVVAVLRDEPDLRGRRLLVCGLCDVWWPVPRTGCAACGETEVDRLEHHVSEGLEHVRIDECTRCERYVKTIDLRVEGAAVPVVDEIGSVALDLWARARGLKKLQGNLLGI